MDKTNYRKKLIEVALPLDAINEESSRRKRKAPGGYPTAFHWWYAQRPIAACRAVIFASFVDDPSSDPAYMRLDGVDEEAAGVKRAELFNLMEELITWENSCNQRVLQRARAEIARCIASRAIEAGQLQKASIVVGPSTGQIHAKGAISGQGVTAWELVLMRCSPDAVTAFLHENAPPLLDPFAGGGSIPLEAQRLGLRAIARDLNPVAVLINRGLVDAPVRFGHLPPVNDKADARTTWEGTAGLIEDIEHYGQRLVALTREQVGRHYPSITVTADMVANDRPDLKPLVGQTLAVTAFLWARTIPSPDPSIGGAHVPLITSFWLSTKKTKPYYVRPVIDLKEGTYSFRVVNGKPPASFDPSTGTKLGRGASFKCLLSNAVMEKTHVREQFRQRNTGVRLLACACDSRIGRIFLDPTPELEASGDLPIPDDIPDEGMPTDCRDLVSGRGYGFERWAELFTPRQLLFLSTATRLCASLRPEIEKQAAACHDRDAPAYADAVVRCLAAVISRLVDYNSAFASWRPKDNAMRSTIAQQAIPMVWDFAEANPFAKSSSGMEDALRVVSRCLCHVPSDGVPDVRQANAAELDLNESVACCTDPPYYDNVSYADLSDFFYVWLRRSLGEADRDLSATLLTPKSDEIVASVHRHGGSHAAAKAFFEERLGAVIGKLRSSAVQEVPLTIFYAFKQSESDVHGEASTGWETFLTGVVTHGFMVTGTWPMRTEGDNRQIGIGRNALASSILLACRPRSSDAAMATRREFLSALTRELPDAMRKLQIGNIAPVDLAQAAIGPGMSVFSRYRSVVESDGSEMTVRTALTLINQVLDEVLAEQEGEFDGDTRWALAWFEQHGTDDGLYGAAETLSKAKNTSVEGLSDAGLIQARRGKVRLIAREGMPEDWDPTTDSRATCWEATQHLIRRLQNEGEQSASELLTRLGGDYGERARDLAYRLYSICERKGWAQEALAYNSLVIAWSEISKLSRTASASKPAKSAGLFE